MKGSAAHLLGFAVSMLSESAYSLATYDRKNWPVKSEVFCLNLLAGSDCEVESA